MRAGITIEELAARELSALETRLNLSALAKRRFPLLISIMLADGFGT